MIHTTAASLHVFDLDVSSSVRWQDIRAAVDGLETESRAESHVIHTTAASLHVFDLGVSSSVTWRLATHFQSLYCPLYIVVSSLYHRCIHRCIIGRFGNKRASCVGIFKSTGIKSPKNHILLFVSCNTFQR